MRISTPSLISNYSLLCWAGSLLFVGQFISFGFKSKPLFMSWTANMHVRIGCLCKADSISHYVPWDLKKGLRRRPLSEQIVTRSDFRQLDNVTKRIIYWKYLDLDVVTISRFRYLGSHDHGQKLFSYLNVFHTYKVQLSTVLSRGSKYQYEWIYFFRNHFT